MNDWLRLTALGTGNPGILDADCRASLELAAFGQVHEAPGEVAA